VNVSTEPGNFGDPFGINMFNEEMRTKEICHGRFAIICGLGIFVAEMASGRDAIQHFRLSAIGHKVRAGVRSSSSFTGLTGKIVRSLSCSTTGLAAALVFELPPPFAPAELMGSGVPLGFFDPLGVTKVGDVAT
jgi:hypothetical protein